MKYIRTKDGRIIKTDGKGCFKEWYGETLYFRDKNQTHYLNGIEFVTQSDTIEELCDEAVAVYPDGTHDNCSVMHIVDNNGFCEAVYGCLSVSIDDLKKDYECWEVYGAVWTNKGLIYVAKMNSKGDLELI